MIFQNQVYRYEIGTTLSADIATFESFVPEFIEIHPTNDPKLQRPSPRYLGLHYACCKVAHLSGAGEYIDNILRNLQGVTVLAEDGSSSRHLLDALAGIHAR